MRWTRRQLIAGAAAASPVLAAAAPALAAAATDDDQQQRLEAALTAALELEQTAVVAYEAFANSGRLTGRASALLRALLEDDRQHAERLVIALEAADVKPPIPPRRGKVPGLGAVRDDRAAARFAIALEERTIGAYSAAVRELADPNLLRIVAGAMGADGQHLVVLRQLAGRTPVPRAFERGRHP
jgi:rubrerythrin